MTPRPDVDERFWRLLDNRCNGPLAVRELEELETYLTGDAAIQRAYLDFCRLHTDLHLVVGARQVIESVRTQLRAVPVTNVFKNVRSWTNHNAWAFTLAVAIVFYGGIGVLVWSMSQRSSLDQYATVGVGPSLIQPLVEQVSESTECVWEPGAGPRDAPNNATPTRQYRLVTGTAEITFQQGTQVVIEGPTVFDVQTANAGHLHRGKLAAIVPTKARGFTVNTPSSRVIDLGTEFSVEVNAAGQTGVHVVRGTVDVMSNEESSTHAPASRMRLTAGQSARNEGKGFVAVGEGKSDPFFARSLPRKSIQTIDLVDIVAGGDGQGHRRGLGIDPSTGRVVLAPTNDYSLFNYFPSDGKYHRPDDRPLVDGVAIIDPRRGPVQLDSAGHVFTDFPKTNGEAYGPIWAGGIVPKPAEHPAIRTTFDGKIDYAVAPHGLLVLIPNKLITFDLEAIRRIYPHRSPTMFRATIGLTKPSDVEEERGLADTWIFVDGKVCHSRREINAGHGPEVVEVLLTHRHRFLTLAATDAGNTPFYDWVLFADPQIDFESTDQ